MNFDETIQVVKKYNQEISMFCTSFTFIFVPLLFVVSEALVLLLCSITKAFLYYGLCVNCHRNTFKETSYSHRSCHLKT
jgi:hypothetical protein